MKFFRFPSAVVLLASILPFSGCTDAWKQRYVARHVLGLNESDVALAGRAMPVPFEDLRFAVNTTRNGYTIRISSEKWQILGVGTGWTATVTTDEVTLDQIAGIPHPSGGTKTHQGTRTPGRKLVVKFMNEDGSGREVFRER